MSLINGGPLPLAVAAQETLPRPEAREPALAKPLPKGEAAAHYQANRDAARQSASPRQDPDDVRGRRVDIDA